MVGHLLCRNALAGLRPVGDEALDALVGQDMLEQTLDYGRRHGGDIGPDQRALEHDKTLKNFKFICVQNYHPPRGIYGKFQGYWRII